MAQEFCPKSFCLIFVLISNVSLFLKVSGKHLNYKDKISDDLVRISDGNIKILGYRHIFRPVD